MKLCFIPDTQVKPGVNTDHLEAAGKYIAAKKPDIIVHAGDHADMPSLSTYEKPGSKYFQGKSYRKDIDSAIEGMNRLVGPIFEAMEEDPNWNPRMVMTLGNHEYRITRAIHLDPVKFEGLISIDDLGYEEGGWELYGYQEIVEIEGVMFCHNFSNPNSLIGGVVGGTINTKLNNLGTSFAMGHQQARQFGTKKVPLRGEIMGLVAGRFYSHDEDYLGPQGQDDWSGIIMMHNLKDGKYDPCFIGMDYLLEKWL